MQYVVEQAYVPDFKGNKKIKNLSELYHGTHVYPLFHYHAGFQQQPA